MVFSSILFIFYFLTSLLLCYFIVPKKYRNLVLLIFSLLFYFLGEPKNIIFLLLSCLINYYLSVFIAKNNKLKVKKTLLILGLIYNIGTLIYFKYTNFILDNIKYLFHLNISNIKILMPIGISFYTFQAISYLVDVYKEKHPPAQNLLEFSTYLTLFAQLIAGPIVRFQDIAHDLKENKVTTNDFYLGIKRFIIGLSKKVLLANVLGELITKLTMTSVLSSWLKPFIYTLQIYFDFSGYSDMAIGLGLMLGFHFLENFNYPLISTSITDFWHRWHISLSSFFRDYIYIPLGGNRVSKIKWLRNILIVWLITGLWHGASWNFVIWGLYFGIILIIEKLFLKKYLDKSHILNHIYSFILITISFLIFSTENLSLILEELQNMFFLNNIPLINKEVIFYLKDYFIIILIAIISTTPLIKKISAKIKITKYLEPFILIALFIICVAFLIDASFNPFLYFRF